MEKFDVAIVGGGISGCLSWNKGSPTWNGYPPILPIYLKDLAGR